MYKRKEVSPKGGQGSIHWMGHVLTMGFRPRRLSGKMGAILLRGLSLCSTNATIYKRNRDLKKNYLLFQQSTDSELTEKRDQGEGLLARCFTCLGYKYALINSRVFDVQVVGSTNGTKKKGADHRD